MNNRNRIVFFALSCFLAVSTPVCRASEDVFSIRGTLPWHNFLSGPSAWNLEDYQDYIDAMAGLGMNFIGFHCYTGGAERYVSYVEPTIRVQYMNVLPCAEFDTSMTSRWGYSPLYTTQFAFNTGKLFPSSVFGAECALRATSQEDRYRRAQQLMRQVMDYAHDKNMKFCLGFEFGIYPPEFFSVLPPGAMMSSPYLPDPLHPANIEILERYIQDIVSAYPGIDYIWFWLQEMYQPGAHFQFSGDFQKEYDRLSPQFDYTQSPMAKFNGVWSVLYIEKARAILQRIAPNVKMVISGWGGGSQLPPLLPGLHKVLPKDIIFSCLNPDQGWKPHDPAMANLEGREAWVIPWLEGDRLLWHPQPRVSLLAEQVSLAASQGIDGVIGIHWRTQDIRDNFAAMARFMKNPVTLDEPDGFSDKEKERVTRQWYEESCREYYGEEAAKIIAPWLTRIDVDQTLGHGAGSEEYFPYMTHFGRLTADVRQRIERFQNDLASFSPLNATQDQLNHIVWLSNTVSFILLLDETGQQLEIADRIKNLDVKGALAPDERESKIQEALNAIDAAPLSDLFTACANRVYSRGELGVLSSLNQKLWVFVQDRKNYLQNALRRP
ncbi:MAG: hypothetical protein GC154_00100 [bacterium]|nr:hypothetical protein [bacterium]